MSAFKPAFIFIKYSIFDCEFIPVHVGFSHTYHVNVILFQKVKQLLICQTFFIKPQSINMLSRDAYSSILLPQCLYPTIPFPRRLDSCLSCLFLCSRDARRRAPVLQLGEILLTYRGISRIFVHELPQYFLHAICYCIFDIYL